MTPRLLVFTPTYRNLLRPETVASVAAQQFSGDLVHEISDHNPHDGDRNMENVLAQYQRARQMTLDGGYDGLLTVEHDMRIPPHAAESLWDTQADVAYGVYVLRHGTCVLNAWRYENATAMGMSLSLYPDDLDRAMAAGEPVRVSGVGFGCTLIRRQTLQRIPFRGAENSGPDMPFAGDCLRAHITAVAHFGVECDHYHEGTWLTVEQNRAPIARFLPNQNLNANAEGRTVRLEKGVYLSLPTVTAMELQRAGYGTIANDAGRETAVAEQRETAEAPIAKSRAKRA